MQLSGRIWNMIDLSLKDIHLLFLFLLFTPFPVSDYKIDTILLAVRAATRERIKFVLEVNRRAHAR